jgi:indolepyruvate ferredoxin oxidoreductase alpha subunit
MDNRTTAMTGHQPNAGVNIRIDGTVAKAMNEEDFAKAAGYEFVEVIDAYEVKATTDLITKGLKFVDETGKPAVIVARRECALMAQRGVEHPKTYVINTDTCIGCKICVTQLGCQAIGFNSEDKKAVIDATLCVGCGVCSQICPVEECIVEEH